MKSVCGQLAINHKAEQYIRAEYHLCYCEILLIAFKFDKIPAAHVTTFTSVELRTCTRLCNKPSNPSTLVPASDKFRNVHKQFWTSLWLGLPRCIASACIPPASTITAFGVHFAIGKNETDLPLWIHVLANIPIGVYKYRDSYRHFGISYKIQRCNKIQLSPLYDSKDINVTLTQHFIYASLWIINYYKYTISLDIYCLCENCQSTCSGKDTDVENVINKRRKKKKKKKKVDAEGSSFCSGAKEQRERKGQRETEETAVRAEEGYEIWAVLEGVPAYPIGYATVSTVTPRILQIGPLNRLKLYNTLYKLYVAVHKSAWLVACDIFFFRKNHVEVKALLHSEQEKHRFLPDSFVQADEDEDEDDATAEPKLGELENLVNTLVVDSVMLIPLLEVTNGNEFSWYQFTL
ncbi:hypothetical protein WN51_12917 [Melipona quadrifasciata]|uniref:Uncharacterized protein n=1 Tax=Melipona quadrifasciata TaxID=166423 RepID=A0A0N0BKE1_9HYME|nr:hypothetical protein WN51_12917 [Melipona quadrifasciata]